VVQEDMDIDTEVQEEVDAMEDQENMVAMVHGVKDHIT